MKYTIAVSASPEQQSSSTAHQFARALLKKGHTIERVFFLMGGVYNGNSLAISPQDEVSCHQAWLDFTSETSDTEMIVCVSAALRRGIIDKAEAGRYELEQHCLEEPFVIGGLGQLVDGMINSDRFVHFGG